MLPSSASEKRLVTKKLRPNYSSNLILTVNDLFNNPLSYFKKELPDKFILFNQQSNKSKHSTIPVPKQRAKEKPREYRGRLLGSLYAKASSFRSAAKFKNINPEEFKSLYSKFKPEPLKYSKSSANTDAKNNNCNLGTILDKEKHIVEESNRAQEKKYDIIDHLCNKTKRNKDQLVISKSSYFRLKKEVIDDVDKDIQLRTQMPFINWPRTLRNKNNTPSVTDSSKSYSVEKPKRKMMFNKDSAKDKQELIIKPRIMNKEELKEMKRFLDNSYLKKKVSTVGHRMIIKKIELSEKMNLVEVKGSGLPVCKKQTEPLKKYKFSAILI